MNTQSNLSLTRLERAKQTCYNPLSSITEPTRTTRKLDVVVRDAVRHVVRQLLLSPKKVAAGGAQIRVRARHAGGRVASPYNSHSNPRPGGISHFESWILYLSPDFLPPVNQVTSSRFLRIPFALIRAGSRTFALIRDIFTPLPPGGALPSDERTQVSDWLITLGYSKTLAKLAQPRPEGLDLKTHRSCLHRFYKRYQEQARTEDLAAAKENSPISNVDASVLVYDAEQSIVAARTSEGHADHFWSLALAVHAALRRPETYLHVSRIRKWHRISRRHLV